MGKTFKYGDRNHEKRMHRVRREGYLFPDSDMAEIDNLDERLFDMLDKNGEQLRGLDLISIVS
jgi:hypothetical protein